MFYELFNKNVQMDVHDVKTFTEGLIKVNTFIDILTSTRNLWNFTNERKVLVYHIWYTMQSFFSLSCSLFSFRKGKKEEREPVTSPEKWG